MHVTPRAGLARRPGLLLPAIFTAIGLAVLLALGTWQLERKQWKEALIATLSERLSAPAEALPPRERWDRLEAKDSEFRRVTFAAEFLHGQESLVYAAGSAFRPGVSGPGYWVFTPARLSGGGVVIVNRGFVPEGRQDPSTRKEGQVAGVVDIAGVMRWPEQRGAFTPADDTQRNLWFVRDHQTMAEARRLGPVAPFYVEQEAPPAPGGLPRVGRLQVNPPNNHLQYALTWFGLAVALLVVFGLWARGRRHVAGS